MISDYPVLDFNGGKRFILVQNHYNGPRSEMLGILYVIFGFILVIATLIDIFVLLKQNNHNAPNQAYIASINHSSSWYTIMIFWIAYLRAYGMLPS